MIELEKKKSSENTAPGGAGVSSASEADVNMKFVKKRNAVKPSKSDNRPWLHVVDDVSKDLAIDTCTENGTDCLYVCTKEDVSIRSGSCWRPSTATRLHTSRDVWINFQNLETRRGQLAVCYRGGAKSSFHCNDLRIVNVSKEDRVIPKGTRVARLDLKRCV